MFLLVDSVFLQEERGTPEDRRREREEEGGRERGERGEREGRREGGRGGGRREGVPMQVKGTKLDHTSTHNMFTHTYVRTYMHSH